MLHDQGVKWYDLGGNCGNDGLRQFKSGIVGKHGVIKPLPGNFDRCNSASSLVLAKLAFGLDDATASLHKLMRDLKPTLLKY